MNDNHPVMILTNAILMLADSVPPEEFQPMLGGIIGNVCGNMSEEYWQRFSKIEPCGAPGCDCHLSIAPNSVKLFALMREDYKRFGPHEETHIE